MAKEGGNQDDFLDRVPAETWIYTCEGTITTRTVDLAAVGALGGSTIDARVPVADFATAQVTAFHPAISVVKSASPTTLQGGGDVTYTYRVRNTGDVPLADVASRIADDTCSPVRYVSGDQDKDGLLDSPNSLFEDSLDETWVFTCTAFVDHDTTNTVVVSGSASGPTGDPLCAEAPETRAAAAPAAAAAVAAAAAPTCDPTDSAQATVVVTAPASPIVNPGGGAGGAGGELPFTGVPPWVWSLAALGLALLLAGWGLRLWTRRDTLRPLR